MEAHDDVSKKLPAAEAKGGEKRLRVFRKKAPQTYLARLERAVSQRLHLSAFLATTSSF